MSMNRLAINSERYERIRLLYASQLGSRGAGFDSIHFNDFLYLYRGSYYQIAGTDVAVFHEVPRGKQMPVLFVLYDPASELTSDDVARCVSDHLSGYAGQGVYHILVGDDDRLEIALLQVGFSESRGFSKFFSDERTTVAKWLDSVNGLRNTGLPQYERSWKVRRLDELDIEDVYSVWGLNARCAFRLFPISSAFGFFNDRSDDPRYIASFSRYVFDESNDCVGYVEAQADSRIVRLDLVLQGEYGVDVAQDFLMATVLAPLAAMAQELVDEVQILVEDDHLALAKVLDPFCSRRVTRRILTRSRVSQASIA